MATFNYSTGNPANLVAGATASMNDIKGPFDDLKAEINNELEPAFASYKTHLQSAVETGATIVNAATTYVLLNNGLTAKAASVGAYSGVFYIDPADWGGGSRGTKLRLRASYVTNGVQSGQTATLGLYPVSAVSAGAVTVGTVTSGSTVAFANPAINTLNQGNSGDFTAPTAGYYAIAFATGAAWTASSTASIAVQLQVRQV